MCSQCLWAPKIPEVAIQHSIFTTGFGVLEKDPMMFCLENVRTNDRAKQTHQMISNVQGLWSFFGLFLPWFFSDVHPLLRDPRISPVVAPLCWPAHCHLDVGFPMGADSM